MEPGGFISMFKSFSHWNIRVYWAIWMQSAHKQNSPLRSICDLFVHLSLSLQTTSLRHSFNYNIVLFTSPTSALLDLITLMTYDVDYKLWNFSLRTFFNPFLSSSLLNPNFIRRIILGEFNVKIGAREYFQTDNWEWGLHQDSKDNDVGIANFATSINLVITSTMFLHRDIHKYTWTSPDGKTHNQIGHILTDRRWHSSIQDVWSFRGSDCNTDLRLVAAKVREDWQ